jgi:amino acid transporter
VSPSSSGGTIGAGILRTPSLVMTHVGSPGLAIAVWIAAGLFAMAAAASLAELAAAIPKSGGFYVFAQRALGDRFGFVAGSADWFANSAAVAFVAVAAAEYLGRSMAPLATHQTLVASAAIAVVAASQLVGQRASGRVQEAMSLIKTLAFATLVVLFFAADGPTAGAAPPRVRLYVVDLVSLALALQLAIGAYDGWQSGSYFAGEDGRSWPQPAARLHRRHGHRDGGLRTAQPGRPARTARRPDRRVIAADRRGGIAGHGPARGDGGHPHRDLVAAHDHECDAAVSHAHPLRDG